MMKAPNSRTNLNKAIERFAANPAHARELRDLMANAIVAHMIGDGVVKGGSGLRFRYGDKRTRVTMDLDTAWKTGLDEFLKILRAKLEQGWNGFAGEVRILRQASVRGLPFDYVMQPCEVKLKYLGMPWYTVMLEVGHNEIGDANECDMVEMPEILCRLFDFLNIPRPGPIPAMRLEYQVAQKLHGVSAPSSKRAHDLIDLQLIVENGKFDMRLCGEICKRLFKYRKGQKWPPVIFVGEGWAAAYNAQKADLPVLASVDEAVKWANNLINRINETT